MANSHNQKLYLDAIPSYDGNQATLGIFISACESFLTSFYEEGNDDQNAWLLRLIISKLTGRALTLIASREGLSDWTSYKGLLVSYFGDQRNTKCLVRDLLNLRMDKNETPYQYGMRVQDVRSLILTKLKLEEPNAGVRLIKTQMYDEMALDTFLNTIPERISDKIRLRDPKTLEQAMNLIIEEENVSYYRNRLYNPNANKMYKPVPKMQPAMSMVPRFTPNMPSMPNHYQKPMNFSFNPNQSMNNQAYFHRPVNQSMFTPQRSFQNNFAQNNFRNPHNFSNVHPRFQQPANKPNTNNYKPTPMDTSSGNTRQTAKTNFFKPNPNQKPNFVSEELFCQEIQQDNTENDLQAMPEMYSENCNSIPNFNNEYFVPNNEEYYCQNDSYVHNYSQDNFDYENQPENNEAQNFHLDQTTNDQT